MKITQGEESSGKLQQPQELGVKLFKLETLFLHTTAYQSIRISLKSGCSSILWMATSWQRVFSKKLRGGQFVQLWILVPAESAVRVRGGTACSACLQQATTNSTHFMLWHSSLTTAPQSTSIHGFPGLESTCESGYCLVGSWLHGCGCMGVILRYHLP